MYHRILERQIKKHFGNPKKLPKEVLKLLETISTSYDNFDNDRLLIERSLELSSKELIEKNKELQDEIKIAEQKAKKIEKLNELMVGRELKMIELKEKIKEQNKK